MRPQPETRARSAQEAGKRALNLWGSKANQACMADVRKWCPSQFVKLNLWVGWKRRGGGLTERFSACDARIPGPWIHLSKKVKSVVLGGWKRALGHSTLRFTL